MNATDGVIEFLQALVRAESLSGAEHETARLVEAQLTALGFEAVRCDRLGNVIARRSGSQPGARVLFDAHMDVVPVTSPAEWQRAPFGGEVSAGRVWGRGAADTKASLAAMLYALASLPVEQLRGELYFCASVGEEVLEGAGLSAVLDAVQPDLVIIGEPTDCRLGIAQRGRARLAFSARGVAAHSSSPDQSGNAVYLAAGLVERIRRMPLPTHPQVGSGLMAAIQIQSQPFPSLSTQPYLCEVIYDRRLVPGETAASILAEYARGLSDLPNWDARLDEAGYTTWTGVPLRQPDFHPAWALPPDHPAVRRAVAALESAGIPAESFTAPYCTNGSASGGECGIPTLIFGPGSITQAHAVDESIPVEEVLRGMHAYAALARGL
ncbi:MAG: M20/M25/M40 family metallo-hydrolase [Bellilinea sp.]|jgi:putative selenium metabolism hydrolase